MPTPGTTGILFSVEDTRKYSRSPGGPPTFINTPDEANMKGQCSNRGRQQKNIEPAGKTNHDKARQQDHQDANENMSPPSANKPGGNQRQPPFHSGATSESTTCLTRGVIRETQGKVPIRPSSPSAGSSSSAAATAVRGKKRYSTDAMASFSSIEETDVRGLVDKIKSRNMNNGGGKLPKGGPWMEKEDEALRLLVQDNGEREWGIKANLLNMLLVPVYATLVAQAWAKGETPEDYGRAASQCLHRWKKVLKPGLTKGRWAKQEDDHVRTMVRFAEAADQPVKWSLVADLLPGRLGKQCRERWFNHLDPAVKKTGWTSDEDEVIFHAQTYFGPRWCEIRKLIPGRTENAIKNRFNSSAKKRWLDEAGAVLGGETSELFIEELRRTVRESNEKKGGAPASSSREDKTAVVTTKSKQPRYLDTRTSRTNEATASSMAIVYGGFLRENSTRACDGGKNLVVCGLEAPAATGSFSVGVRRSDAGSTGGAKVSYKKMAETRSVSALVSRDDWI